jgi:hypothetical protein
MVDFAPIGSLPPVGEVPKRRYAQVIRSDQLGGPVGAFKIDEVDVPAPGKHEVMTYHNEARTHLSLGKDAPIPREVHGVGRIFAKPHFGGLHHQYIRI